MYGVHFKCCKFVFRFILFVYIEFEFMSFNILYHLNLNLNKYHFFSRQTYHFFLTTAIDSLIVKQKKKNKSELQQKISELGTEIFNKHT